MRTTLVSRWRFFIQCLGFAAVSAAAFTLGEHPILATHNAVEDDDKIDESREKAKDRDTCVEKKFKHVLIISVDGLREADLNDPALQTDIPNLNGLRNDGIEYTNAHTTSPTDSFPGQLGILTGASPRSTGVYYDDSYSRTLYPSIADGGTPTSPPGAGVLLAENLDFNSDLLNGGGSPGFDASSINPANLPQKKVGTALVPMMPHEYLKVNTLFEIVHEAHLPTAYADKHPAYEIAFGPSGKGVDDFYAPEIDSLGSTGHYAKDDPVVVKANDDLKVQAMLNVISGKTLQGKPGKGVPAVFAMNFQAVSVGQKIQNDNGYTGGISPSGVPSVVFHDLVQHTDASIGKLVKALKDAKLWSETLVVISAKHGQSPRLGVGNKIGGGFVSDGLTAAGITIAHETSDTADFFWLADQKQTLDAVNVIKAIQTANPTIIKNIYYQVGAHHGLTDAGFGDPTKDDRTPDIIVETYPGNIFTSSKKKQAEHGGFSDDETHVGLILTGGLPHSAQGTKHGQKVSNRSIAVLTLEALGLDPLKLQGVRKEGTPGLPGMYCDENDLLQDRLDLGEDLAEVKLDEKALEAAIAQYFKDLNKNPNEKATLKKDLEKIEKLWVLLKSDVIDVGKDRADLKADLHSK